MNTLHDMRAILGDDFFKEEVRCDYLVSEKMKKIWAVEMDMYLAFAEICEKYGFKYYAVWGTMIGAVRHNGFIPWDDDVDVVMPREDYNKFLKIAGKEFTDPLFLQTPYTDPGYLVSWAKLRNSTTTAISKKTRHRHFNQGIFLDIFPMDNANIETIEVERKQIYQRVKRCGAAMKKGSSCLTEIELKEQIEFGTDNPLREFEEMEVIASQHKESDSYYVAVLTTGDVRKKIWPKKLFESTIDWQFESIKVKIPMQYAELLDIQYSQFGGWREFPPISERGVWHADFIFDPNRPYTDYLI